VNCPRCQCKASIFKTIRVSRWSNYKCVNCGTELNRTGMNSGLVSAAALLITFLVKYAFTELELIWNFGILMLVECTALYIAEKLLGKLVPENET